MLIDNLEFMIIIDFDTKIKIINIVEFLAEDYV